MKELGIVIPFLNEEGSLANVVNNLVNVLNDHQISFQILLINDGSTDKSGLIADHFALNNSDIKVIHNKYSQNIGNAYKKGLIELDTKYFTWLPSDGEIHSSIVYDCYKNVIKHQNPCITYPIKSYGNRSLHRLILSKIFQLFCRTLFRVKVKYFNGIGLYQRSELVNLDLRSSGFTINLEVILKHTLKYQKPFSEVPFVLQRRMTGNEKALKIKNILNVINMLLSLYFNSFKKKS